MKLGIDENNSAFAQINGSTLDFITDSSGTNTTRASFGANSTITGGTITIQGTAGTTGDEKLVIADNSITIDSAGDEIFSIVGGTMKLGTDANNGAFAQLDGSTLDFITDSSGTNTSRASFGVISRIGDVAHEHISMSGAGMTVKDGATVLANFASDITLGEVGTNKRNVFIDENVGVKIRNNTTDIASFGSDVTLTGGTLQIKNSATKFAQVDSTGLKVFGGDASNADAFFGAGSAFIGRGSSAGSDLKAQIKLETIGGKTGIRVTDKDAVDVAFIGESAAIAGLGSGGTSLPTTNAVRGIVTAGLTADQAIITGSLTADSGDIAKITGDILTITGSANVGGLVASGSVRNTSTGAATAVMIHVADASNTKFQVLNDGEVLARDNITAFTTGFTSISDKRLKTDIQPISESLDKIVRLKPTGFTWIEKQEKDIGFIAQEVEEVIPELIHETRGFIDIDSEEQDDTLYKSISYDKLTIYLVDAIKELTKRVEELEKENKILRVD